jgi:hypothetical protein
MAGDFLGAKFLLATLALGDFRLTTKPVTFKKDHLCHCARSTNLGCLQSVLPFRGFASSGAHVQSPERAENLNSSPNREGGGPPVGFASSEDNETTDK